MRVAAEIGRTEPLPLLPSDRSGFALRRPGPGLGRELMNQTGSEQSLRDGS